MSDEAEAATAPGLSFDEWLCIAVAMKYLTPQQRLGQHLFNSLRDHRGVIAESLRASNVDPFYVDERIGDFLNFVRKEWDA